MYSHVFSVFPFELTPSAHSFTVAKRRASRGATTLL
jgi:hypothetical protein